MSPMKLMTQHSQLTTDRDIEGEPRVSPPPRFNPDPVPGYPERPEEPGHLFHERRRSADEAHRRRMMDERREIAEADPSACTGPFVRRDVARDGLPELDPAV